MMTLFSQPNRRILQAILQQPNLTQRANFSVQGLPLRTKAAYNSRPSESISVTFGFETDQRLADLARPVRGTKSRTRKGPRVKSEGKSMVRVATNSKLKHSEKTRSPVAAAQPVETSDEALDIEPVTIELPEIIASDETIPTHSNQPKTRQRNVKPISKSETSRKNSITPKTMGTKAATFKPRRKLEDWQAQKEALEKKFGETGWNPRKRLSPDAIDGLRHLHEQDPERYSTPVLAEQFKISAEAIRRILKSKWKATDGEMSDRRQRWARRHDRIWDQKAAMGLRPPRTGDKQPDGPEVFEEQLRAKQMLGQI